MGALQLQVVSSLPGYTNVVAFALPASTGARLSIRDRMDVTSWLEPAFARGYDRLVIHERTECDPPEIDSFLSIYRRGESWSRWGVARCGATVLAWCSVSGMDIGRFASMAEALGSLLEGRVAPRRGTGEVISVFV